MSFHDQFLVSYRFHLSFHQDYSCSFSFELVILVQIYAFLEPLEVARLILSSEKLDLEVTRWYEIDTLVSPIYLHQTFDAQIIVEDARDHP